MARQRAYSAIVLLLTAFANVPAVADQVAATLIQGGAPGGTVTSTQGWDFTPSKNLLVTRLGMLDVGNDGFAIDHAVGIWTSAGTPLVWATIPSGTTAPLTGSTRFVSVPPVLLAKNQTYVIGAYYLNSTDTIYNDTLNGSLFSYDPAVTPGSGRFGLSQSELGFPSDVTTIRRLGPNFAFTIAADLTWPTGAAPCNDIANLAACIDAAAQGDIVEIAANAIPGQDVFPAAAKGITLRPATGFTPVFGSFTGFYLPGGDAEMSLLVQGITIANGTLRVGSGSGHLHVTLRDNVIQSSTWNNAIEVANRSGPTDLVIENNQVAINVGPSDYVSAIMVWGLGGSSNTGRIAGNTINQVGGGQQGAIEIYHGSGTLSMDVIGNRISGTNFNTGVGLFPQSAAGSLTARVINNTITGQVNYAGGPAAIAMYVSEGAGHFTVVNNTVAYNQTGIQLGGRPDLGATATALVANNIVAFQSGAGMNLQDFLETTTNAFNIVHGNGYDEYTPGPGTLTGDPLFISSSDLRPLGGSPALNTGLNSLVPVDVTTDVAGSARIQGIVDRGAFELASGGVDTDADGVADAADNCRLTANASQRDADGDNFGNACDADLNQSGMVTSNDYSLLRSVLNQTAGSSALAAAADMNDSGLVTVADFNMLRARLNTAPGPSGLVP